MFYLELLSGFVMDQCLLLMYFMYLYIFFLFLGISVNKIDFLLYFPSIE